MALAQKQTKRYRGQQLTLLRKLIEVITQIENNNDRYLVPPNPNRRFIDFSISEEAQLTALKNKAQTMRGYLWPILSGPGLLSAEPTRNQ